MFVYRAEKNGYGPFRASIKGVKNSIFLNEFSYMKPPMYRGDLRAKTNAAWNDIYYGCPTIEHLDFWFDFDLLECHGFKIAKYSVPEGYYETGHSQMIFVKKMAILIQEISLPLTDQKTGCVTSEFMVQ